MLLEMELTQIESDLIWMAKGFFYRGSKDFPVFVETPTAKEALACLRLSQDDILKALSRLIGRIILDADDPISEFAEMQYFVSRSLSAKMEKYAEEFVSKQSVVTVVNDHILDFNLIVLAKWEVPDNAKLLPPSWDPEIIKKKKRS